MDSPVAVKIAPWLTTRAGLGPAMIVLLAIAYHLCRRELLVSPVVLYPACGVGGNRTFVSLGLKE